MCSAGGSPRRIEPTDAEIIINCERVSGQKPLQYLSALCVYGVCLSGSGQERDARSDAVQGDHVDSAVHQKLLPVGERSEEPASLPGEVL